MRIFITLICGLVINFTWTQFQDDFGQSSGFPNSWEGQTSDFHIQNEKLQLNASSAGNSTIYLPPSIFYYSETEFRLKVDLSFSPSGNNRLNLFIYSDSANALNSQNAFYLQFGESGSNDAIALRGIFNGVDLELIRGLNGRISSSFELDLKLTWIDSLIKAEIWNPLSNLYETEWTYIDTASRAPNILSLNCNYTSSNADKFSFDDLYIGPIQVDTLPPNMILLEVLDSNSLLIHFDELIDTSSFNLNQIQLSGNYSQNLSAFLYENGEFIFHFPQKFDNDYWSNLILNSITDMAGNVMTTDTTFHLIYGDKVQYSDIELTEIMADPSPSAGLPECEYLEVYNSSSKIFDLSNLLVADATDTSLIDTTYFLFPGTYLLIVEEACLDSFVIQNRIEIDLPSLNNSADRIALLGKDSSLIDSLTYSNTWHEPDKDEGGYALEKAELGFSCGSTNWFSSLDSSGGSPSVPNTHFESPLNIDISVINWMIPHTNQLTLIFNKEIENSLLNANISSNLYLVSHFAEEESLHLTIGPEVLPGTDVIIEISGMQDCFGNELDTILNFSAPYSADVNDLLINEVLFDPISGGTDFVELYNHSQKTIDLKGLFLANRLNDTLANRKPIANTKFLLEPQKYCVISKDSNWIQNVFETNNKGHFIQISSLPSMPNEMGSVVLVNEQDLEIDEMNYDQNMHYPLLEDLENKSLERIAFEVSSLDLNNWNTASGNHNFGTPGYQNSQQILSDEPVEFSINSDYFSPNNDGQKDNLLLEFTSESPAISHLRVFNMSGQEINRLVDAEYVSGNHSVIWDGLDSKGNLCNSGIYIFHLQLIYNNGQKRSKRKTAYLKR